MFEIFKRILSVDTEGNRLEEEIETVTDDDLSIRSTRTRILNRCENCHRPAQVQEVKGVCEYCRQVMTCNTCFKLCAVCHKVLCGHCSQGIWMPDSRKLVALCPDHFAVFEERHVTMEAVARERANFERFVELENQKLRLIESPVMGGRVLGLVKKCVALSMLKNVWNAQRELRERK